MPEVITEHELRNNSEGIVRRLELGETFLVTRNGVPVGQLTPMPRRRQFVSADAVVAMFRQAPRVDAARFRADLDAVTE